MEAEEDGYLIAILKVTEKLIPVTEVIDLLGENENFVPTAGANSAENYWHLQLVASIDDGKSVPLISL